MNQGFYQLTSQMISQSRNLNVISNNMANAATPGYKSDTFSGVTFEEKMMYRSAGKGRQTPIGTVSRVWVSDEVTTDLEQGALEETGRDLDLALKGNGFFAVQTQNGIRYTRAGSFAVDENGALVMPGGGQVMGVNGPIALDSDRVIIDEEGRIFSETDGSYQGQLQVVEFEETEQLTKQADGLFQAEGAANPAQNTEVVQGSLEASNVSMMGEMVEMMKSQRAIQSAAQILKMYDQLEGKGTQIGSIQ